MYDPHVADMERNEIAGPGPAEGAPQPRRTFLTAAGAAATAGVLGEASVAESEGGPRAGSSKKPGTVLAIGSHYDDAAFGIPGILLQAAAKGYRVVILSLIGDYTNWKPVRGRGPELVEGTRKISADYGAEARFLDLASGQLQFNEETRQAVAEVVADVKPDVAFMLWSRDQHPDHEVASQLSKVALRLGDRLLPDPFAPFRPPRRIYLYDNGPRHTIGFVPDTFVDVTPEWPRAIEWLGRLMALVRNEPYEPGSMDGAQRDKDALARYRGFTCGADYAEALVSGNAYPQALF
jgi:LmbE family N-acetylglucosaminyl deacetylase